MTASSVGAAAGTITTTVNGTWVTATHGKGKVKSSVNSHIFTVAYDTALYVGGAFSSPGNDIAKWDGTSWSALGTGMNDIVNTLTVLKGDLYAGGQFTSAGGTPYTNDVARWDGSTWNDIGGGVGALGEVVYTLAGSPAADGSLYVGGTFSTAGSTTFSK